MISLNQQPKEKRDYRDDGTLDVINIWDTIQGEGPYAGCPAVFVRFAGCNLNCQLCDTNYTENRQRLDVAEILQIVQSVSYFRPKSLVVFTGGEPFRQSLSEIVELLYDKEYIIQIETNGTYFDEEFPYDKADIVCSPKASVINPKLLPHLQYLKYTMQAGHVDKTDGLPTSVLGEDIRPARPPKGTVFKWDIWLQPVDPDGAMDGGGQYLQNLEACVDSVKKYNYRLGLQLHKYIGAE